MDQQIDLVQVEALLTSDQGKLIAAAILFLVVWLLKNVPWIAAHVVTPWQKRAFALGLAFIPTLAMALTKAPNIRQAFMTTLIAFLGSTAFHHFVDGTTAGASGDPPSNDPPPTDDEPGVVQASDAPSAE